jgi:hypothetical protein
MGEGGSIEIDRGKVQFPLKRKRKPETEWAWSGFWARWSVAAGLGAATESSLAMP